jgi:hypothetical protein
MSRQVVMKALTNLTERLPDEKLQVEIHQGAREFWVRPATQQQASKNTSNNLFSLEVDLVDENDMRDGWSCYSLRVYRFY